MQFELVEAGFPTEDEAWEHARPYAVLLRKTGVLYQGWMITVRQVADKDRATGRPSLGIYAVRYDLEGPQSSQDRPE